MNKIAKELENVINGKTNGKLKSRAVLCPVEEQMEVTRWLKANRSVVYHGASYYNGKLVYIAYETDDETENDFCGFTEENFGW